MKRTPLTRKSGLKRGKRLRRVGRRAERREEARREFREAVWKRAGYRCERCGEKANRDGFVEKAGGMHLGHGAWLLPMEPLDAHHLLPYGKGGKDDSANGVALCRHEHRAIHDHACDDWQDWLARDEAGARAIRKRLDGDSDA